MTASETIHASVSPDTAEKLRRVVAAIKPEHLDIDKWLSVGPDGDREAFFAGKPTCGTVACLAGWACAVLGRGKKYSAISTAAQSLLGLNDPQSFDLFQISRWPGRFVDFYEQAESDGNNTAGKLAALRDRVEHFIATGK